MNYARGLLKQNFDFSEKEELPVIRDEEPWPKTEADNQELWRKRVKNDWLRLKLAGNDDATIRTTLGKRYANSLSRAYKYKSEDVFQIFMNAYTNSIEPHTDYFGPAAASDFDISMWFSLVGIGPVLQEREGIHHNQGIGGGRACAAFRATGRRRQDRRRARRRARTAR